MAGITPTPSANYGDVVLQPNYFTSSLFVNDLNEDIDTLIRLYGEQYVANSSAQPFALFKDLWKSQGWTWFHLMVLDDRARQSFLTTVLRLFLERTSVTEPVFSRATALFGFYTFLCTQPIGTAPSLLSISHVPIPLDLLDSLRKLPASCNEPFMLPFRASLQYILEKLESDGVFLLVPSSELNALNPAKLPREIYIEDSISYSAETDVSKKKGRPSKRDKAKKARANLEKLDSRLEHTSLENPPILSLEEYTSKKGKLLDTLRMYPEVSQARAAVAKSNHMVLERLKAAETSNNPPSSSDVQVASVGRIERAVNEVDRIDREKWAGGALTLVEGAGMTLND